VRYIQFKLKTLVFTVVTIALAVATPYALIAFLILIAIASIASGLYQLCWRKPLGIKGFDWYYLAFFCLLYIATCFGYVSHFHSHFRTHVGGGTFVITAQQSNRWGANHTWRYGPLSEGVWRSYPAAKFGRTTSDEHYFRINIPIWIPILLAAVGLALKHQWTRVSRLTMDES